MTPEQIVDLKQIETILGDMDTSSLYYSSKAKDEVLEIISKLLGEEYSNDSRQKAIEWWSKLSKGVKNLLCTYLFVDRVIESLTGREIQHIYEKIKP